MRKIFIITIMMLVLTSCANKNVVVVPMPTASPTAIATPAPTPLNLQYDNLNVQYIRINDTKTSGQRLKSTVFNSISDVNNYFEQNKYNYNLIDGISYEYDFNKIGFADAVSKYDDEYFNENALLILELEEGSGSITHNITSANVSETKTAVQLQRLVPEAGTDDMSSWIIIVELPRIAVDGKEIIFETEDLSTDVPEVEGENVFAFTSGKSYVEALNHITYSRVYAEENGKKKSAKDDKPLIEDIAEDLPEIIIESNFLVAYPNVTVRKMTIYDEQFEIVDTSDSPLIEHIIEYEPGTYYIDLEYVYTGKYIITARENNYFRGNYYVKLILPDKQYGLANRLEQTCNIDFSEMDSAEFYMFYDGMKEAVEIEDDGAWRLLTYLRASSIVPVEGNVSLSDISRKIVLYSDGEEAAVFMKTFSGIYAESHGQGYYLDVPPWCFELMIKSIAGKAIIPLDDVIFLAKEAISEANHIKLWEDINCKVTSELIQDTDGYNWQIVFTLVDENGKDENVSSVTITGHGTVIEVKGSKD